MRATVGDEIVKKLLDQAWEIISRVSGGNWQAQQPEWRDQAIAFRDSYWGTGEPRTAGKETEFGPATSDPMTWTEAVNQLRVGRDVIRTGPGGCLIRCHSFMSPILLLSATSRGHDQVRPWSPCEDDRQAENWVTVDVA